MVPAAAAGLLTLHSPFALLFFAFLMGFGLGPLYPLFLSRVLRIREGGNDLLPGGRGNVLLALPDRPGLVVERLASHRLPRHRSRGCRDRSPVYFANVAAQGDAPYANT